MLVLVKSSLVPQSLDLHVRDEIPWHILNILSYICIATLEFCCLGSLHIINIDDLLQSGFSAFNLTSYSGPLTSPPLCKKDPVVMVIVNYLVCTDLTNLIWTYTISRVSMANVTCTSK